MGMYTAAEVAALLRLHPVVVRAKCARGELPGVKIAGNRWRIPAAYIDRIVEGAPQSDLPDWLQELAASGAQLTADHKDAIRGIFAEAIAGAAETGGGSG